MFRIENDMCVELGIKERIFTFINVKAGKFKFVNFRVF